MESGLGYPVIGPISAAFFRIVLGACIVQFGYVDPTIEPQESFRQIENGSIPGKTASGYRHEASSRGRALGKPSSVGCSECYDILDRQ